MTRPIAGRGGASGGSGLRVFRLFLAGSASASLLSVHVCRSFDPLDLQDGKVTEKLRPKEDSDAFISMFKAVHSRRQNCGVEFFGTLKRTSDNCKQRL